LDHKSVDGGTGDTESSAPRLAIVCGHQRSGTTALRELLNTHPEVMVTGEFRNFSRLGAHLPRYLSRVLWHKWRLDLVSLTHGAPRWRRLADGGAFVFLYALGILLYSHGGRVTLKSIRSTLHTILPWAGVVGDKYPGYIYRLDRLAALPELKPIVIFRDCRDVVSSTLEMARTEWKGSRFAEKLDTPQKVASRWVEAVALQERNASRIFAVRYEDLVTQPEPVLERLGSFLEIDPSGFCRETLRSVSIGRYRQSLRTEDLQAIKVVAGDTMLRLGYI
jgi:hypothetical protein